MTALVVGLLFSTILLSPIAREASVKEQISHLPMYQPEQIHTVVTSEIISSKVAEPKVKTSAVDGGKVKPKVQTTVTHVTTSPEARPTTSWKSGSVTAYCNCHDSINGNGTTYSGYDLGEGITFKGYRILSADSSIKIGTLIDIKLSNGDIIHAVVLDRGGAIHGSHFDLVLPSYEKAMDFGVQNMSWRKVGSIRVKP